MTHRLDDYDWQNWTAEQHATLLFIVHSGRVLLIQKKRGLGAGKINGPGGKLEAGETPQQCAIRETQEELHVTPLDVQAMGEIAFQFTGGLTIQGYVFRADAYRGVPTETDEADPVWCAVDAIPYDRMWPDDAIWLPWLLSGHRFSGRVLIADPDTMLDQDLRVLETAHQWPWQ